MFFLFFIFILFSAIADRLRARTSHKEFTNFQKWRVNRVTAETAPPPVAKVVGYQTIYAQKSRIIGNLYWWLEFWCTRLTCATVTVVLLSRRVGHQRSDMDSKHRQITTIMNYIAAVLHDNSVMVESVESAVTHGVSRWSFFLIWLRAIFNLTNFISDFFLKMCRNQDQMNMVANMDKELLWGSIIQAQIWQFVWSWQPVIWGEEYMIFYLD